ncbi:MAG TPA: MFS transporter, partial [Pseudonocardia sp.]
MASWSSSARRGVALDLLIGALTVGSTLPHLIVGGIAPVAWSAARRLGSGCPRHAVVADRGPAGA